MSDMKKTIFIDIDGCIVKHKGNLSTQILEPPELLAGVLEKLNEWDREGYKIILTTGRKESMRKITEEQLSSLGVFYEQLVMGIHRGERVIINDFKEGSDVPTASAICIKRNAGLTNITI